MLELDTYLSLLSFGAGYGVSPCVFTRGIATTPRNQGSPELQLLHVARHAQSVQVPSWAWQYN